MATDNRIVEPSALCSLGHRPITISGLLVQLLRAHFANPNSIEHDEFRERLWAESETTKVMIEDWTVWKPEISGLRPAVIVRRNDWQGEKRTINNQQGTTPQGHSCHIRFVRGSTTLFCIAKEGAEVELLGAEVARYLAHFGPVIRSTFELLLFEHVHQGTPGHIKEASDRFAVPVTFAYAFQETWTLTSHAPLLKTVQFKYLFPPFGP